MTRSNFSLSRTSKQTYLSLVDQWPLASVEEVEADVYRGRACCRVDMVLSGRPGKDLCERPLSTGCCPQLEMILTADSRSHLTLLNLKLIENWRIRTLDRRKVQVLRFGTMTFSLAVEFVAFI